MKRFLRTLDACVTLTEIQVHNGYSSYFSQEEMRLLRDGRTERNNELCRLEADPDAYPERDLLVSMLKMENNPTGLFKVLRKIPAPYMLDAADYWKALAGREHG